MSASAAATLAQTKAAMSSSELLDNIDTFNMSVNIPPMTGTKDVDVENINAATRVVIPPTRPFDPIDFLNHHYQTESAIVEALPELRSTLHSRITQLDDSISNTIQKQSDLADLTLSDVTTAKTAIVQLHNRISTVQSKARLSEKAVQEITQEMKRLDFAKKHLSKTITALKRLHMLIHAVTQLQHCVRESKPPQYKNAANLIDATQLLIGHFEGYMDSVEKMRLLKQDVEDMRTELYSDIIFGFRVVGFGSIKAIEARRKEEGKEIRAIGQSLKEEEEETEENITPMSSSLLKDACIVIDALGENQSAKFMKTFCQDHLEPYSQLFDPHNNTTAGGGSLNATPKPSFKIRHTLSDSQHDGRESAPTENPNQASLDQVERRYAWYRRMLRDLDEKLPTVFPNYWDMQYHLTHAFLSKSGEHFKLLFTRKDGSDKHLRDRDCENVTVLLKALQKTILFEKEMTAWLQREYGTTFFDSSTKLPTKQASGVLGEDGEPLEFDEHGRAVAASSAEGIRIKYERKLKDRNKVKDTHQAFGLEDNKQDMGKRLERKAVVALVGVASSAFDKFMGPYISLEEQNMDEQLLESKSDSTVDTRGDLPVFTSSTELFIYIKNSITRCTKLTTGRTLFLLFRAFQDTLRQYAQVLSSKFPSQMINIASLAGSGAGENSTASYRIPEGEETTICHVIDTCEYCVDTVEALQDLITDKIEEQYKAKIDMNREQEAFQDVTAKGIRVLVSGLCQRTDQAFKTMTNINWSTLDGVGEESNYVRSMNDTIQPFVITVKNLLPSSYFRSFCDKFAVSFTSTVFNTITRCKRISEAGTQQLLLDVYNLKTLLLKLPILDVQSYSSSGSPQKPGSTIAPAMYTKQVTKDFQRIEILLKLVGTPSDLLIDVFKVQWNGGSALDLQTVMNLKGMPRNKQAAMLESFGIDPVLAMKGAAAGATGASMTENIQALQDKSSDVAAKVNSDLFQMRQKVEDFRKTFRT